MSLEAHLHDGERKLARTWKAMALRGVVGLAFSITQLVLAFRLRRMAGKLAHPFHRHG